MNKGVVRLLRKAGAKSKLRAFLDANEPELVKFLQTLWQNQGRAITYKEIREAILSGEFAEDGEVSGEYAEKWLDEWRQDYSRFVTMYMLPSWEKAMKTAAKELSDSHPGWYFNPAADGVKSWTRNHAAAFVTNSTRTQIKGLRAVIHHAAASGMNVDTLSYVVRPMVGLTYQQGIANVNYFNTLRENGMSEKKALKKSILYGQRQHRYRGYNIARTELAFAYNHGMLEGVRQAQGLGYIGTVVKRWVTADDERTCSICAALNDNIVEMDADFRFNTKLTEPGIKQVPPAHPSCRCAVAFEEVQQEFTPDTERFVDIETLGGDEQSDSIEVKPLDNSLTNATGKRIIEVKHTVVRGGPPNGITQLVGKNGGIDRNYYGPDGRQIKQISNSDHNRPDKHPFGKHGEHAHDYTWDESGRMTRGSGRELEPYEREENSDIL